MSPRSRDDVMMCTYYLTDHTCNAPGARLFPEGWRCPACTPRARKGLPEYGPGPGWPKIPPRAPRSYTALNDQRAIASGKRRSNLAAYREAQSQARR